MRKNQTAKGLLLTVLAMFMSTFLFAQADKSTRPSPPMTATGKVGSATITINYSAPSAKGRTVMGGLIPYDKVWRAGANEATIFETDKDVKVGGKAVPAGKYSLYVIATPTAWTIIINSETGQWGIKRGGDTTRDPAKDVALVTVKSKQTKEVNERLVYKVLPKGFSIAWDTTEVVVPIK